ncbi:YaaA family protein [Humidisolicoccus flavus]|uniref:YaaA family protein n=1 Tax=Humidisolicoccus flavus TaxID=3111414 RepID=UPI0032468E41
MIILLPPSETKSRGGAGAPLDAASLGFPSLAASRVAALSALERLVAAGQDESTPAKRAAAADNAAVSTSPTVPAIERYTGVLYDALDARTLDNEARAWLGRHVVVHSALFGLVRANDLIPAYKISSTSKLPGTSMGKLWKPVIAETLDQLPGPLLDLRSGTYRALGPGAQAKSVHVVERDETGATRALNHWNKRGKGLFVRALAQAAAEISSIDDLIEVAREAGQRLSLENEELVLVASR